MFWNPYSLPAIIGGIALYFVGIRFYAMRIKRGWQWAIAVAILLSCLPALSFDLYYAHLVEVPGWYIAFRSLTGIESLAMCWGLLFGFITARVVVAQAKSVLLATHGLAVALMLCCVAVPFVKPVLHPIETVKPLQNVWQQQVCRQTCGSTCGPASLATILAYFGRHATEREIARGTYASTTGTELWYLLRYARRHGLRPSCLPPRKLTDITFPAIVGVTAGDIGPFARSGHFITVLGQYPDGRYCIGDPLSGRELLTELKFQQIYGHICDVVEFSTQP